MKGRQEARIDGDRGRGMEKGRREGKAEEQSGREGNKKDTEGLNR